jgi:ribosomal protein S27AE
VAGGRALTPVSTTPPLAGVFFCEEIMASPSITCPRCGRTSYHPKDIQYSYCGYCHVFNSKENQMDTINMADELWAWVTEYPDGSVSLIVTTAIIEGTMLPLIGRSEGAIRKMEPLARVHGKTHNQKVWFRRYVKTEDFP